MRRIRLISLGVLLAAVLLGGSCSTLSQNYGSYRASESQVVREFPFEELHEAGWASARIRHRGTIYNVFAWRAESLRTRLMLSREEERHKPFLRLERAVGSLERRGEAVLLAANGGMFLPDYRPAGLYVEEGKRISPMRIEADRTNFGMLPNGVFAISDTGFIVAESEEFRRSYGTEDYAYATQSGPLLLEGGELHPRFRAGSDNTFIRSGVGVTGAGINPAAYYAISESPVNFYDFATLFREVLLCREALYLDGHISRAYIPGLGRDQAGGRFGPMLLVSDPDGGSRLKVEARIEFGFRLGF